MAESQYSLVVVGTGFASSFFLSEHLKHAGPRARVLVLERGARDTHIWQVKERRSSSTPTGPTFTRQGDPAKGWGFTIGFGGGSNCWWAGTPRMMPNDFRLKSKYGIGRDWPLTYDDLNPYYDQVEEMMQISGPDDGTPFPRTKPYPQPPHRMSRPDQMLKRGHPGLYFVQPTARARIPTRGRGVCCGNGVCFVCPVNAKFTIQNSLAGVYSDPRVTLRLNAVVDTLDTQAGVVTGVRFREGGREQRASADLVVLGANAVFNPLIMMRSGIDDPMVGKRLHEQVSLSVDVDLDGVDNFQGSTVITGLGYMFYDGEHRRDRAACMVESWNKPDMMRYEQGKWRQLTQFRLVFEDLPDDSNCIKVDAANPERPILFYKEVSGYAMRGIDALKSRFAEGMLKPLPVEKIHFRPQLAPTENHVIGTTVMGNDPSDSVVDRHMVHHRFRNLVVLGSGGFPTCSPANPTLTISALSLWAASHLAEVKA